MSTEHSPASPAVAVGPCSEATSKAIRALRMVRATARPGGPVRQALDLGIAAIEHEAATSRDLLAACEAAVYPLERIASGAHVAPISAAALLSELRLAVARARGLRPCDDPALVPEVLQAQPQCVHGEKVTKDRGITCPVHGWSLATAERHEHPNGGVWYTYVCDGFLSEQKVSAK